MRYQYFFLEAVRMQEQGKLDAAHDLLSHALSINPNAPEAHYLMAMYLSDLGLDSAIRHHLELAAELAPDNSTYQERLAQYFISTKHYDEALAVYEELAENHHDRTDVLEILMQFYQNKRDYDRLLDVVNRIEQQVGTNEELTLTKMRVYELKGDQEAARLALQSLADEHPNDLSYRVMMGNWLMKNNRQEDAGRIFTAALQEEPDNAYVQASAYDYFKSQGQDSLAKDMMERILVNRKAATENKVTMIRQLISENQKAGGDSTEVLDMFNRVMAVNPKDIDMAELKVAYMTLKNMPEEQIRPALQHILDMAPDNVSARVQLLQFHLNKMEWKDIITLCTAGTQYNPDEMVFYYYLGLAHYQEGDEDQALNVFQRGVSQIREGSNANIVSDFYYFMGDILHHQGRQQEAFAAYDSCLQWKDDNIACLNNYAYYLSLKGKDEELLRRAEKMSYKTVQAEPENSTYLDTYAWILFMQGRNEEARIYIDQAIANDTDSLQSGVVIEHAGDIHAVTGDIDGAVDFWQKAYELNDDAVDMTLLQKKIKQRKYIKKEDE